MTPPSAFEFIVREGPDTGKRIPLPEGRFTIGSGEGCAIRLPSNTVREKHAEVQPTADGGLEIADLTGASLMWVNGAPASRAPLVSGTEVRVGRVALLFVSNTEDTVGTDQSTLKRPTPFQFEDRHDEAPLSGLNPSLATGRTAARSTDQGTVEPTAISGRFAPGDLVDKRYRILTRIAAGGMGEVFKVEHLELGKQLALKVMLPGLTTDQDFVNRFKIEAVAASRIGHPNIVDISDFGQTSNGRFFFVMEFLDGMTLSSLVHRQGAQPPARVAELGLQVARALAAAHELHIVHRDLKPDNVMVMQRPGNPDLAKVLDFGVARVQVNSESIGQTAAGLVVGTPQYMSPEQAKALVVDARSDIYSLGLILHELLVGKPAFSGETPPIVMVKQVTEPAPPLPDHVPEELDELITRMLEKNPLDRPQQMKEVVEALDQLRLHLKPTEVPKGTAGQNAERVATPGRSGKRPAHTPTGQAARTPAPVKVPTPPPQTPTADADVEVGEGLRSSNTPILVGVLLGLLLVVVGGGVVVFGGSRPAEPQVEVVEPAALEPPPVTPAKPPVEQPPAEVVVRILSTPEGVEVFENGVMLGNTPLPLHRKPNTILDLSLSLTGYQTAQRKVMVSGEAAEVSVTLEKTKSTVVKPKPPEIKGLPPALEIKPAPF